MSSRYFIRFKGRVLGPMTQEKVMDLVHRAKLLDIMVSPDGCNGAQRIHSMSSIPNVRQRLIGR